jgi:hypothetical protein
MKHFYLYLLTLAYAFSTFASGILMPIYAFFVQKIGGGLLETSCTIALYSIICGIGTIVIHKTKWSHTHAKFCLWGGWLLWLLSMVIYLLISNIFMLYISQLLNGIADAICEPVFFAQYSKRIAKDPSAGWALFTGITTIFSGFASIAGGLIVSVYGFDALLYCLISIAIVSFLLIAYYADINDWQINE